MHTETTIGCPIPVVLQRTLASMTLMDDFDAWTRPAGKAGMKIR